MVIRLFIVSFLISSIAASQDADVVHRLDYDRNAPVDIREAGVEQHGGVAVRDISYASPKGGRVPAYLDYGLSAELLREQIARSGCWSRAHAQSASCHEVLRCRADLHAPVGWEIITALFD